MDLPPWSAPPDRLQPEEGEVHLWRIGLELPPEHVLMLWGRLTAAEHARADRFRAPDDRDRFRTSRAILRQLLGSYLNEAPKALRLATEENGKPILVCRVAKAEKTPLQFNLSHTDRLALCAVTRRRRVGIDIERVRPIPAFGEFAQRFFSPVERERLFALPEPCRHDAFFQCWARKEAYLKARGEGLSRSLASFDVSVAPGEPARLLATRPDASEASRWSLARIDAGPGYAAALAVEGSGPFAVRCWDWANGERNGE
jgi:4'-phosphopantetheinyl transferase